MAECYGEEGALEPRIRCAHLAHPLRGRHGGVAQPSVASIGEWATGISVSAPAKGGGQSRVTLQMSGAGEPAAVVDLGLGEARASDLGSGTPCSLRGLDSSPRG